MNYKIDSKWEGVLKPFIDSGKLAKIIIKLNDKYKKEYIYPKQENIFKAFKLCSLDDIKVVILGQDPYHGPMQANGLAFSVLDECNIPPSLKNIFKEINDDVGELNLKNGNLEPWAKQGVLLLNSLLTVKATAPMSHKDIGWEGFTDYVIKTISNTQDGIVFLLWGNSARNKKKLINTAKHLVLEAPHPSPLSANRGFFGCKHFSTTNKYLKSMNKKEILW